MRERLQRSSGTGVTARDVLRTWKRLSREAASAADIAAIDRGDGRTVFCSYRGLYGSYPRRFAGCWLDLTPDGPVIRPMLLFRFLRQRIPISEPVIGARVRPFDNQREALQLVGAGQYATGGLLEQSGSVVISCETSGGLLEFAVRRPDIDLVLHFFDRLAQHARSAVSAEDA
jgi:hypothetical protein